MATANLTTSPAPARRFRATRKPSERTFRAKLKKLDRFVEATRRRDAAVSAWSEAAIMGTEKEAAKAEKAMKRAEDAWSKAYFALV